MRKKPWALLMGAIVCGGLSAYLSFGYLRAQGRAPVAEARPIARLLVAARDLAPGTVVRAEDLKSVEWPQELLPSGYLASPELAVGKGVLTPVRTNEPLLQDRLTRAGGATGLSLLIPPGMRAVSVKVDEVVSVAGFVMPGSRVDVLVTVPGDQAVTRLVLQNVRVLAVGQAVQPAEAAKAEASVITLLVAPDQAERLALASAQGRVQLALRNGLDDQVTSTPGAALGQLHGGGSAAPAAARVARRSGPDAPRRVSRRIEIYQGPQRTLSEF